MSDSDKKIVLKLKTELLNVDGSTAKDPSKDNHTKSQLVNLPPSELSKDWPPLTLGILLIGLINNRDNIENVEEIAKLSNIIVKIRNKMLTDKGEWIMEKQELLDLADAFKKGNMKKMNVYLHGQAYNIIQDLLIKSV